MKKAVVYGAGNIGRGFIGKIFHNSGYEVVFLDINMEVIDRLNQDKGYVVRTVSNKEEKNQFIDNVRGVDGKDLNAVVNEIATADIMATSIGVNILPYIIKNISEGIKARKRQDPLNIFLCENLLHAAGYVNNLIEPFWENTNVSEIKKKFSFVEVTIGCMIPALSKAEAKNNPTLVMVEPFCNLPVSKDMIIGPIPKLSNSEFISPFEICEEEKLFIHNMSHALCSYFGYLKGYEYVWQAIDDNEIFFMLKESLTSICFAISEAYDANVKELLNFSGCLLERYKNKKLNDPITRVGRDPFRKTDQNDRMVGAINRCKKQNKPYDLILKGIACAMKFDVKEDSGVCKMKDMIEEKGIEGFLREHCKLDEQDVQKCKYYYNSIGL